MRATATLLICDRRFTRLMLRLALVTMLIVLGGGDNLAYADGGGGSSIGSGLASLTKLAVDALIVIAALILALGFAFSGVSAQIGALAGLPYAQATAITRIAAIIGFFLLVVFSIPFANAVIDNVSKYRSNEAIHLPQ